jgi:hypothetical protein
MLIVVPRVTTAYNYSPVRYRTRWSPYAFGLVSGNIHYSPYAFSYKHSGLVPDNLRYSPYAFSYNYSGLVADPWYYDGDYPPYIIHQNIYCPADAVARVPYCGARRFSYAFSGDPPARLDQTKESYGKKLTAYRATIEKLKQDRITTNTIRQNDGKEIICAYLKSKNIDFTTNRLLNIDDKTVSVDFLIKDKNIIIKYWNTEETRSLAQKPEYKRNFYERYKESSSTFCEEYKKSGGKVYQIQSANEKEILAALLLCPELSDG